MKRAKFIAAAILLIGAANACADDARPAEQPNVGLVSVDNSKLGVDLKIASTNYPNGVFVQVDEVFGSRPVSASIFAAELKKIGFKIADKAENADAVFMISSTDINFKEIDQSANGIDARKVDAIAGVVGTAVATGGWSLFVTDWSRLGNARPVNSMMIVSIADPKNMKKTRVDTMITGVIKIGESSAQATRATFEILSDEWMKAHVVGYTGNKDSNLQSAPASAVSASK